MRNPGSIVTINSSEIHLKLDDTGTKHRVALASLRQGNAMLVKN